DDAFQHRSVATGLNILLTEYAHPFTRDYLLPSGRLREWRAAYSRADVIIVSKCPQDPAAVDQQAFLKEIKPFPHQQLFFSYYHYLTPYYLFDTRYQLQLQPDLHVLLISAIARTEYLTQYLAEQVAEVSSMEFEDHHTFTNYDIARLRDNFQQLPSNKKVILTTEKDAMRLEMHREFLQEHKLPVFVLPVEVRFHPNEDGKSFDRLVQHYLLSFKS
ncbi:MAG: tetraacyldisaccharide 4'-kinase, partial [Phaeodactylibacter sp.]|nr:tetraacyldisaccharide 4'-kinase [Phaeodactylibacter sp.]